MNYFKYTDKEISYLTNCDERLAQAIKVIGKINREVTPDLFTALIKSIIGQQISTKAANTVWERLLNLINDITPINIDNASLEDVKNCGLSYRKATYIKDIANIILNQQLDLNALVNASDDEIIKVLTSFKGIGKWTAEMLMIFSMERPNILSWDDLAIRRGIMMLYNFDSLSKEQFEIIRHRFSPYNSVASLYLWAIAGGD